MTDAEGKQILKYSKGVLTQLTRIADALEKMNANDPIAAIAEAINQTPAPPEVARQMSFDEMSPLEFVRQMG